MQSALKLPFWERTRLKMDGPPLACFQSFQGRLLVRHGVISHGSTKVHLQVSMVLQLNQLGVLGSHANTAWNNMGSRSATDAAVARVGCRDPGT